jgi:hypothetical protein
MDFNQQRHMEDEYYCHFQSLHQQGITFFKALQQDGEETHLKINTLLYRPHDAPSTWTDLFWLWVFPDFPEQLDLLEHGESIAHVENPDTFQVGYHNNKQLLFLGAYLALIKEEIPEESVMNHYFNMVNPSDRILFALFQWDYQGYGS